MEVNRGRNRGQSAHNRRRRAGDSRARLTVLFGGLVGLGLGALLITASVWQQPKLLASGSEVQVGNWQLTGPMSAGRAQFILVKLADGRVMAAGGADSSGTSLSSVELFDPSTYAWTVAPPMSVGRSAFTATLLKDGRVLVTGGFFASRSSNGMRELSSAEVFDPSANRWTPTPNMSVGRAFHTATLLTDGRVLVVGTGPNQPTLGLPEIYDPVTNTWIAVHQMVVPSLGHTATLLSDGRVLVVGGAGGDPTGDYLHRAEIFDPSTGAWTLAGSTVVGHSQHSAVLLRDGTVLVVGGAGDAFTAERFNPATNLWTRVGRTGSARFLNGIVTLADGRVLLVGGMSNGAPIQTSEIFDPSTSQWSTGPGLVSAHGNGEAVRLNSGAILIVGGMTASVLATSATELLEVT